MLPVDGSAERVHDDHDPSDFDDDDPLHVLDDHDDDDHDHDHHHDHHHDDDRAGDDLHQPTHHDVHRSTHTMVTGADR